MRTRPLIIIITTFLYCLEPLGKIGLYSLLQNVNLITMLEYQYLKLAPVEFFLVFLLLPAMGILLYTAKKWSYFAFLSGELYLVILHGNKFLLAPYFPNDVPNFFYLIYCLLHIFVILYFTVSNIKMVFLYPALRFWETDPRYRSNISIKVYNPSEKIEHCGLLLDISKTGAYIANIPNLISGDEIEIKFSVNNDEFCFFAKVVHNSKIHGVEGNGIKFINMTDIKKIHIAFLVKSHSQYGQLLRNDRDIIERTIDKCSSLFMRSLTYLHFKNLKNL